MSEENELRVKFVIDDTDFRNQLDQLRGDLERERRLEPSEPGRPSQTPNINLTIGGGGGEGDTGPARIDPEDLRQIHMRIDDVERRSGTPRVFEESTPTQLRNLLGEAMKMPGWENILLNNPQIADKFAFIAGEAERRYPDASGKRVTDIRREGDLQTVSALRNLYDSIYRISGIIETRRETGLATASEEALREMVIGLVSTQGDTGEDKARMSAFHRAEQLLLRELLSGPLGKTAGLEMRSGRSKFDVYAPFRGALGSKGGQIQNIEEEGTGWGLLIAEVKGTRATGVTATQGAKYIREGVDILRNMYKDDYKTAKDFKEYMLRYPKISGRGGTEAGRIKLYLDFITMMKGGSIKADILAELQTGSLEDRDFYDEMFQTEGIQIVESRMPQELQERLAKAWEPGMTGETLVPVMFRYLDEFPDHLEKVLSDLNPSFSEENLEATRKKLREIIGSEGPREQRLERGTAALSELLTREGPQYVMQAAQEITGQARGELFPDISRRAGRRQGAVRNRELAQRLVAYLPGLAETLVDMGEINDEEIVEAIAGSLGVTGIDPAITRRRDVRDERNRLIADMSSGSENALAYTQPYGREDDPEEGPSGYDIMMDILDSLEGQEVVGALPMDLDLQQYMRTLSVYAEEVQKEYKIPMSSVRYMRWMASKYPGAGLPSDITEGLTDVFGILGELSGSYDEDRADTDRLVSREFSDFIGDAQDPRMPVNQREINYIREQLGEIRENIITGGTEFETQQAGTILRVSQELEAFEKMYTTMEPATTIMTLRWS